MVTDRNTFYFMYPMWYEEVSTDNTNLLLTHHIYSSEYALHLVMHPLSLCINHILMALLWLGTWVLIRDRTMPCICHYLLCCNLTLSRLCKQCSVHYVQLWVRSVAEWHRAWNNNSDLQNVDLDSCLALTCAVPPNWGRMCGYWMTNCLKVDMKTSSACAIFAADFCLGLGISSLD